MVTFGLLMVVQLALIISLLGLKQTNLSTRGLQQTRQTPDFNHKTEELPHL